MSETSLSGGDNKDVFQMEIVRMFSPFFFFPLCFETSKIGSALYVLRFISWPCVCSETGKTSARICYYETGF